MSMSGRNRRLIWTTASPRPGSWWRACRPGGDADRRQDAADGADAGDVVTVAAGLAAGPGLLATAMGIVAIIVGNDRPGDMQEPGQPADAVRMLALLIDALIGGVHAQRHGRTSASGSWTAERRCERSRCSGASTSRRRRRWASSS